MDPRWAEVSLEKILTSRLAASFGFYHQGNSTQRWVFRQEKGEFYPILVASRCMLVGKVVRKKFAINLKFISFIAWPKKNSWWLFQVLFSIYLDYPAPASQSTYHPENKENYLLTQVLDIKLGLKVVYQQYHLFDQRDLSFYPIWKTNLCVGFWDIPTKNVSELEMSLDSGFPFKLSSPIGSIVLGSPHFAVRLLGRGHWFQPLSSRLEDRESHWPFHNCTVPTTKWWTTSDFPFPGSKNSQVLCFSWRGCSITSPSSYTKQAKFQIGWWSESFPACPTVIRFTKSRFTWCWWMGTPVINKLRKINWKNHALPKNL